MTEKPYLVDDFLIEDIFVSDEILIAFLHVNESDVHVSYYLNSESKTIFFFLLTTIFPSFLIDTVVYTQ